MAISLQKNICFNSVLLALLLVKHEYGRGGTRLNSFSCSGMMWRQVYCILRRIKELKGEKQRWRFYWQLHNSRKWWGTSMRDIGISVESSLSRRRMLINWNLKFLCLHSLVDHSYLHFKCAAQFLPHFTQDAYEFEYRLHLQIQTIISI